MKIETLKRKLITLALHENLSLEHSEEELKQAIRNSIGRRTTRPVAWPGSDHFAPFTVEGGKTILPHFVTIPTDDKLSQLGHPFGCGPNESPDLVLSWLKWTVCVVEKKQPSQTFWTIYRLFDQEEIKEAQDLLKDCQRDFTPYDHQLLATLTFGDVWPEISKKHLNIYAAIVMWTSHLACQITPEKTRKCIQHLLDFGIPDIPQAIAIATGAFLAGTLFDVNALEDSVAFLLSLEQLLAEDKIPLNNRYIDQYLCCAFYSFCAFYSLYAQRHGINLTMEDLNIVNVSLSGIKIPVLSDICGDYYTLPPICFRVNKKVELESLFSYWNAINNKISPLRWGTAVNTFFNTILHNTVEHSNAFLDPTLLAKTTARVGVGVKSASSDVIGVAELQITALCNYSVLRIFTHDDKQIVCWVDSTDTLIKGAVEGFSSIEYYNPYFI